MTTLAKLYRARLSAKHSEARPEIVCMDGPTQPENAGLNLSKSGAIVDIRKYYVLLQFSPITQQASDQIDYDRRWTLGTDHRATQRLKSPLVPTLFRMLTNFLQCNSPGNHHYAGTGASLPGSSSGQLNAKWAAASPSSRSACWRSWG